MEYEITETIMKHFNDNYLGKPYTLENKKNFELYITNLIIDKFLKGQVMVLYNNIFLSEDIKILDILEFLPYSNFVKWTGIYNVYQNYELVGIAEYFGKNDNFNKTTGSISVGAVTEFRFRKEGD